MKRSFAVGGAAFAVVLAIAFSFGAQSAEAQLLSRLRCAAPAPSCSTPKLFNFARANSCAPAPSCCETAAVVAPAPAPTCCATAAPTNCCQKRVLVRRACAPAPTCCAAPAPAPAPTCCAAPATSCCEADPCARTGLLAKLRSRLKSSNNCCPETSCNSCGTATTGCVGCEAPAAAPAEMEKTLPPAPEATDEAEAKPTT